MASANLGPVPYFTILDSNGSPVSGGKLNTYVANSSTPANTYTDRTAATPNANPIVADAAGRTSPIFFDDSVVYKLVFTDANDVVIKTIDNFSVNPVIAKATTLTISGNGTIGGTLSVTGAATLASTLGVTGNFAVNTNKFTVAASSGNTAVAGTLAVTGATALTGALTVQSNEIAATANRFLPKQAMVRVTKSATQSITTSTETSLTFDQESFDTDSLHDNATNNSRLTASVTGKWIVNGTVQFAANNTGYRQAKILKNGTTVYAHERSLTNTAGDDSMVSLTDIVDLAAGDYVELTVFQNSGGGLNVQTAATSFSMVLVGV